MEEGLVESPFIELLQDTKRLPEVVVLLKVNETNFLGRQFNKREIEDQYYREIDELKKKR